MPPFKTERVRGPKELCWPLISPVQIQLHPPTQSPCSYPTARQQGPRPWKLLQLCQTSSGTSLTLAPCPGHAGRAPHF
ncbi:hypothetical protein FQN60_014592 [Etheostoma spectabile]|uniref:Uncharacterized protein n=1 Tax=Etheostoma spectabile TaxID=54343 RepID=A0A5J5D7G9_9PERO|nr:hypothetical protein FQN60_014592 [Etheostoma spectabile]